MKRQNKAWDARLRATSRIVTRRQRNRHVVAGLTLSTVLLAIAGLAVDLWFAPALTPLACYGPATASGIALLAFLFSKRLWVTLPPGL
ncbi:hypothetical protein NHF48_022370 [Sphingomonas sp. H160509]|uniref:hypothetical protein n=1 Tax=Sphingomonas sp. H160509 TaxID=2955313 RepID=UPI0021E92453|nr:hypothetical protein [Sphingomonas sp. H160509]MDD1453045.1 hypothetical protein [Sphingomonas sp. H160509]